MSNMDIPNEEFELIPGLVRVSPRICKTLWRTEFDVNYYGICQDYTDNGNLITAIFRFFLRDGDLYNVNLDGTDESKLKSGYFDDITHSFQMPLDDYRHIEFHCPEILI